MDAALRKAVTQSHLGELPADVLERLLTDASRTKVPAGSITHRERDDVPHLELVVAGIVRAYVTSPEGRTMTIRYCRPGALMGALSLFSKEFVMPGTTQALVDAELLRMDPRRVRDLARSDVRVANALLVELSERASRFLFEIPGSVFASVRQRLARHLLDLASGSSAPEGGLEVRVSQQELADAVGTAREVVVRALRELREDGTVRTERNRIVLLDPNRLIQDLGWNSGS